MAVLPLTIWKQAVTIFKKERLIRDEGTYSACSLVEEALVKYKKTHSEDDKIKLINSVFKSYADLRFEKNSSLFDSLQMTAGDKIMSGNEFINMAEKYDPARSRDGSFLLYFHSNIKNRFKSDASIDKDATTFDVSPTSKKKFNIMRDYCLYHFGCNPIECEEDQLNHLCEWLNGPDNSKLSKTKYPEMLEIINENSLQRKEERDKDDRPIIERIPDKIANINKSTSRKPTLKIIKCNNFQLYVFGVNILYKILWSIYRDHPLLNKKVGTGASDRGKRNNDDSFKDSTVINQNLSMTDEDAIINELEYQFTIIKPAFIKLIEPEEVESLEKGMNDVKDVIISRLVNGQEFPNMSEVITELNLNSCSSVSHISAKIADRLRDVLPSGTFKA